MAFNAPVTSTRQGHASVAEKVEATSAPGAGREGYSSVAELIGYDSVYQDRRGFASVMETVVLTGVSKREGHTTVAELIGYDSVYQDRRGAASVLEAVTYRQPDFDEVDQPFMGWGILLQPALVLIVYRGTAEATASVSINTQIAAATPSDSSAASVSEFVVDVL